MEYTQWVPITGRDIEKVSLNPCCNGIYSMRTTRQARRANVFSLNPCCNGIYSMRIVSQVELENGTVS